MENKNIVAVILNLSVEEHPWTRTISRRVIRNLLTDPLRCAEGVHPASKFVGELVLQALQKPSETKQQKALTTRYLCLLEGLLHKMPKTIFRQLAERILNLGSTGDQMVKCAAFQCIQKTLLQHPGENSLPIETNIELIHVLRSLKTPSDVSVCAYWLKALVEAHICAQLFNWKSSALCETVFSSSLRLINCCVQQNSRAAIAFLDHLYASLIERTQSVDKSDKECWTWTLKTMAGLVEESQSSIVGECFTRVLRKLAEMRDKDVCICAASIDDVFCSAIRHVGIEAVIQAVPLVFTTSESAVDFKRSWLLPLLTKSVKNGSVAFYMKYFVPMAMSLHEHLAELPELQAKLCATAEAQIWALLPKVLDSNPTDFQDTFPSLCPILGAVLNERADLRMSILEALRATLKFSSTCDAAKEIMQARARTSYQSYQTSHPGDHSSICGCHPTDLISTYIQHAVEKVQEADSSLQKKALIMDILIAMSKGANTASLFMIIEAIKNWFSSSDAQMQKKAYRLLAEIYRRTRDPSLNENGSSKVASCAWPWRIATYRSVACSLADLETLQHSYDIDCPKTSALDECEPDEQGSVIRSLAWSVSTEVNALASRLLRILCVRLPGYALEQYKEIIVNAVFLAKPTRTSAARKANVILLEALLDKFGMETLVRCAGKQIGWVKQLKNLEKRRRRREGKKHRAVGNGAGDEDMEGAEELDEDLDEGDEEGNSEVSSDNFIIK
uniref:Ribosomal RNA-processing protein 12-like conserved domain-containing protein n=1 Tax=Ditylenchus dipsaci TaxID=166011 RepID=A0A915EEI7_9BILA